MAFQLKKRHTDGCRKAYAKKHPGESLKTYDKNWTRCKCSWWGEGTLRIDGLVRQSTKQSNLDEAKKIQAAWESAGTVNAFQPPPPPDPNPDPTDTHTTLEKAKLEFAAGYMTAKHLAPGTQRGYRTMLKFLTAFAAEMGLRFVDEFNLGQMQDWQKTWGLNPRSAAKRLELARCFFDFCRKRDWISKNPTEDVEVARMGVEQKEPFTEPEIDAIVTACREYPTRNLEIEGPRVEAITLLMLYGGLRISDAAFFTADQLDNRDRVSYFPIKANTGGQRVKKVTVKIPPFVAEKLRALPGIEGKYLFTTGHGAQRTVTDVWRKKFERVWERASKIMGREFSSKPHPHRFRHTFAVRLLLRGVKIEDVADALGHSDHRITLRHYRQWVPGLQDRLDSILDAAWAQENKPQLVKRG